jgi:hypothetical protein
MSSDNNLQEMEAGTKQSKTAVNAGAAAADPMPTMADPGTQLASVEDLGGPTPENYKSDDDSAKLKEPGATLTQVRDVVTKSAGKADPMPKGMKEESEELEDEEIVAEEETAEEEVVTEEEASEEVVAESEEEVVEEATEEYDIEEDVNALLGEEELSEEFKEKAKVVFEAALTSKVAEIKEALEAKYEEQLLEEIAEIKEGLTTRVDSYLEYVAEEWMTENQLVVEHALKAEMTESFLSGMKDLFEAHYVTIPEDKYNVLDSMVEKLDEMETKLNEQIEKNVSLNSRLAEAVAEGILDQVSDGLADTQKDKLASLAESVEFESEAKYREKLEMLRESYFSSKAAPKAKTETLSEGSDAAPEVVSGSMAAYLKTLSSFAKN